NPCHSLYCVPLRVSDGVGVHVQRSLEIRVAEKSLSGLERLAICMQERGVRVPERVPRNPWLLDPIARWRELPVVQVFVVERSPFNGPKNQVVRSFRRHTRPL